MKWDSWMEHRSVEQMEWKLVADLVQKLDEWRVVKLVLLLAQRKAAKKESYSVGKLEFRMV
jgi:hypothetical protein